MSLFLAKPQRFLVRPAPGWVDVTLQETMNILSTPLQKYKFSPSAVAEDGLVTVSDCDFRQALDLVCRLTTAHDVEWVIQSGRVQGRSDWVSFLAKSGVSELWTDTSSFSYKLSAMVSHPVVGTEREIRDIAKNVWPFMSDDESSVEGGAPQLPIQRVRIESSKNRHRILVSMGGEPLYRRGYKLVGEAAMAPLPEHHASACYLWSASATSGFSREKLGNTGCAFVVPFAGTGTAGFEPLARALNIAPAVTRLRFACESFSFHPEATMTTIRQRLLKSVLVNPEKYSVIFGDINSETVRALTTQVERFCAATGISFVSQQCVNDFLRDPEALFKDLDSTVPVFLPLNPPYGNRLAKVSGGDSIYRKLADTLEACAGIRRISGYVICPDEVTWKLLVTRCRSFDVQTRHFTHGGEDMRLMAFQSR